MSDQDNFMNAGMETIEWLYSEQLKVDEEWSIRTPTGFRWWADKNAQTIEVVGEETGPDGQTGYLVSVRTELLRDLELNDLARSSIDSFVMAMASMSGPVYDPENKTLCLCSLVRVHDEISQWMNPLISLAAVLQIGEARILGPMLADLLGAEEALSGHPQHGVRPEPDEMAEVIAMIVAPIGKGP